MKVLSFGGGVQSTVLALMVVRGEIEAPNVVLFADTGNESEATYQHVVKVFSALHKSGVRVERVSAGSIVDDVLLASKKDSGVRVGQPPFYVAGTGGRLEGKLWRKCSSEYKIKPMEKFIRRECGIEKGGRFPAGFRVEKWLGITTDEASRMKPSRNKWELVRWPLIEMGMTRWDCHRWLKSAGWGVVPKSSCLICPYHNNDYWRNMRDESPAEWQSVCDFEAELHKGQIPGTKSEAYLHRSCVPLTKVDLNTDIDRGQMALSLWAGECEGICGT